MNIEETVNMAKKYISENEPQLIDFVLRDYGDSELMEWAEDKIKQFSLELSEEETSVGALLLLSELKCAIY